jgi:hypothetical protein
MLDNVSVDKVVVKTVVYRLAVGIYTLLDCRDIGHKPDDAVSAICKPARVGFLYENFFGGE